MNEMQKDLVLSPNEYAYVLNVAETINTMLRGTSLDGIINSFKN